jgi:glycosyltransferase involved in cell wall biosynthesis
MPALNAERFIASAVGSVMNQTHQEFEILVIDDGSSDRTREIAVSFPRVRLLKTDGRRGPGAARNIGITHSTGDFVSYLDADDLWFNKKLATDLDYLGRNPEVGLVFSDARLFRTDPQGALTDVGLLESPYEVAPLAQLLLRNFIPCLSVTMRRACLDRVGGFDETEQIMGCEDYDLWLRMACNYRLGHIAATLSAYRLHGGILLGIPSCDPPDIFLRKIELMEQQHQMILKKLFRNVLDLPDKSGMTEDECLRAVARHYERIKTKRGNGQSA